MTLLLTHLSTTHKRSRVFVFLRNHKNTRKWQICDTREEQHTSLKTVSWLSFSNNSASAVIWCTASKSTCCSELHEVPADEHSEANSAEETLRGTKTFKWHLSCTRSPWRLSVLKAIEQRSPTFFKLRATVLLRYQLMRKDTSLIHTSGKNALFTFNYVTIKAIHECEDTDHVNATFRTGPRGTHAGDLVPAGTILVTLEIQ